MEIYLKNIMKKYNENVVLDIDDFHLKKGKIYGIIGPNGAGKSTLLKIIGDIDKSSNGEILYDGKTIYKEILKEITYLNQKPYLFRTSVYNNIAYPLVIRKVNRGDIKEKVSQVMEELKIDNLKNQLATNLSGGESQKVALARAVIFKPNLLLLDEPTANIDPNTLEIIEKAIVKRNKEFGTTIIIVTHNISQANRICDEVILMTKGRIIESGNSTEIITNPQKKESKRFLSLEYNIN